MSTSWNLELAYVYIEHAVSEFLVHVQEKSRNKFRAVDMAWEFLLWADGVNYVRKFSDSTYRYIRSTDKE